MEEKRDRVVAHGPPVLLFVCMMCECVQGGVLLLQGHSLRQLSEETSGGIRETEKQQNPETLAKAKPPVKATTTTPGRKDEPDAKM